MSKRDPVKKNMDKVTKPATHRDRKKDSQRGYEKHKGKDTQSPTRTKKKAPTAPQEPTHAFIDADMPLFMAASAGEQIKYRYFHEDELIAEFDSAAEGKNWIESIEIFGSDMEFGFEGDVEELERRTDYEIGDFRDCKKAFNNIIKDWAQQGGCEKYTAYVSKGSGAQNFRYDVATIKPYKTGRGDLRKPHYLEELRKYAHGLPHCKKTLGKIEVDDMVCAMAQRKGEQGVVVAGDKDARQVTGCWMIIADEMEEPIYSDPNTVGYLYENEKGKIMGHGWLFLLYQVLAGDKADTYGGCKGIGDKKALPILEPFNNNPISELPRVVNEVAKVFEKAYGNSYSYKNHHTGETVTVTWKEIMIEMINLAYMLKSKDDVCPLIEMIGEASD